MFREAEKLKVLRDALQIINYITTKVDLGVQDLGAQDAASNNILVIDNSLESEVEKKWAKVAKLHEEKSKKNWEPLEEFLLSLDLTFPRSGKLNEGRMSFAENLITLKDVMDQLKFKMNYRSYVNHNGVFSETENDFMLLEDKTLNINQENFIRNLVNANNEILTLNKKKLFENLFVVRAKPDHFFIVIRDVCSRSFLMCDASDGNLICKFDAENLIKHTSLYGFYNFEIVEIPYLGVLSNNDGVSKYFLKEHFKKIENDFANNPEIRKLAIDRCNNELKEIYKNYLDDKKEGKCDVTFEIKVTPYICLMNKVNANLSFSEKHLVPKEIAEIFFKQKFDVKTFLGRSALLNMMSIVVEEVVGDFEKSNQHTRG